MRGKELSPVQRFGQAWDKVTSDGTGSIQTASTPAEDGAVTSVVIISAHEEPHVVGSLRPRIRTLEITAGDVKVSLTEGRATFLPGSEYVQGGPSSIGRIITQPTSS